MSIHPVGVVRAEKDQTTRTTVLQGEDKLDTSYLYRPVCPAW